MNHDLAIQNYYTSHEEFYNDELRTNVKVEHSYLEIESMGAGLWTRWRKQEKVKLPMSTI